MAYLLDVIDDVNKEGQVESLEVSGWYVNRWTNQHSIALAHICNKFRVQTLCLVYDWVPQMHRVDFYDVLIKHATTSTFPHLPYLRNLEMEFSENPGGAIKCFINQSRVVKVTCHMQDELERDELLESCDFFLRLFDGGNLCLREISFRYPWDPALSIINVESGDILRITPQLSKALVILERNKKAFLKCQMAIITFLGLKKRRDLHLNRDTCGLVVSMVWQTRGTKDWIQVDSL